MSLKTALRPGKIIVRDLAIDCIIGDLPEERTVEQRLEVTIEVTTDFAEVAKTDNLKDTLDYVKIANRARQIAVEGQYQMIEALAAAILDAVEAMGAILATVRVVKPGYRLGALSSEVEISSHDS